MAEGRDRYASQGYLVYWVKPQGMFSGGLPGRRRRKLKQSSFLVFNQQFLTLIKAGLPSDRWAVVTSSTPPIARARLAAVGLPEPALLITAEDVDQGKPSPDGYLLAAEKLGVPPRRCLVFEDAAIGAAAARSAGMRCVGVGLAGPDVVATVPDLSPIRVTPQLTVSAVR